MSCFYSSLLRNSERLEIIFSFPLKVCVCVKELKIKFNCERTNEQGENKEDKALALNSKSLSSLKSTIKGGRRFCGENGITLN